MRLERIKEYRAKKNQAYVERETQRQGKIRDMLQKQKADELAQINFKLNATYEKI